MTLNCEAIVLDIATCFKLVLSCYKIIVRLEQCCCGVTAHDTLRMSCILVHKRQIVARPHLGIIGHELQRDSGIYFGALGYPVRVEADGRVVAADREGVRLEEIADADAPLEAVPDDLEPVDASLCLRCGSRCRLLGLIPIVSATRIARTHHYRFY